MNKMQIGCFLVFFLSACSSHAPKEREIKREINARLENVPLCLHVPLKLQEAARYQQAIGDERIYLLEKDIRGVTVNQEARKQLTALSKIGFYKKIGSEKVRLQQHIEKFYSIWRLSNKGAKNVDSTGALCMGQYSFKKMDRYSVPEEVRGRLLSEVTYEVQLNLAPWAKRFLQVTDKHYKEYLPTVVKVRNVFYLSNHGWRFLETGY